MAAVGLVACKHGEDAGIGAGSGGGAITFRRIEQRDELTALNAEQ